MSKIKVITVVALVAVMSAGMFSACKKDGVYNPKKKISKIYEQNDNGEKELSETWTWDGNKLARIDYANGNFNVFEYEKDRLINITDRNGNYQKYVYDGSKIDKIQEWSKDGSVLYMEYKFEYKGNKISKITTESSIDFGDFDDMYMETSSKSQKSNALRFVLPEQIADIASTELKNNLKSQKALGTISITMELTWKGNNIEKATLTNSTLNIPISTQFTYDNKSNPMYGFLTGETVGTTSKNNPKKVTITIAGMPMAEQNYSYEYDGNFPTKITATQTSDAETETSVGYIEYK